METLLTRRTRLLGSGLALYYDAPFHPVRGEGVWLFDERGKRYLDAYNNVPHVGHCNPEVVKAMCAQAATLNTNTRYLYESILDYADRLAETTSGVMDVCAFTCTGSEANDLAWRLARSLNGNDGVITTQHGYHGNTTFLDSIDGSTIKTSVRKPDWYAAIPAPTRALQSLLESEGRTYAELVGRSIETLNRSGHRLCAVYLDCTFCSDGMHFPDNGYLNDAMTLIKATGALIIADEVQAGLGRLGNAFWAWQKVGITPDIITSGKPMGNGHPVGAVITRGEILREFQRVDRYFNTYAGNPVSCAAGLAVLDILERDRLPAQAERCGDRLKRLLRDLAAKHPLVGEVRGSGYLLGVEIVNPRDRSIPAGEEAKWILNELRRRGVLVGRTGPNRQSPNVLKIRPPMIFDDTHVEQFVAALDDTLAALESLA